MKIAIYDDEHDFVLKFKDMINKYYPDTSRLQIQKFSSRETFLADFQIHKYDVVFFDIKKKLNGLETAENNDSSIKNIKKGRNLESI